MDTNFIERVLQMTLAIQQIPAPTFDEQQRSQFVLEKFQHEGLTRVEINETGNTLACLPGNGQSAPLIVSAHLDTVFPRQTDLSATRSAERIAAPGIGDNSLGVAALFGLVWGLRARGITLPGDLWLVANTCEEGLGDLRGMKAVCQRFGVAPRLYLVLEGMALGHIYHRGLGVRRYEIEVQTKGGHSWSDYGTPSAINELARLVTRLEKIRVPVAPRTTLNVGKMSGGTSVNTVAARSSLELDLRSEQDSALTALISEVTHCVETARRPGVALALRQIGSRPAGLLEAKNPYILLAKDCLFAQGLEPHLTIGSTDANVPLALGYPSLVLGVTTGGGAHTLDEYVDVAPVSHGMASLLDFVERAFAVK
jgi:tripeptide aminopeptidase